MNRSSIKFGFYGQRNRKDTIRDFNDKALAFFQANQREDAGSIVEFFLEMVKNIVDHAAGVGYLMIKKASSSFEFDVGDSGELPYDFDELVGRSTTFGNGINYGFGLNKIQETAKMLGITLNVDTRKGFRYTGTIPPQASTET